MTASVAATAPPTPRITASQVPGDIEVAQFGDVVLAVAERDGIENAFRRLGARQRLEAVFAEHLRDRAQAIGTLGMTGRRQVVEAGRVAQEKRGHAVSCAR